MRTSLTNIKIIERYLLGWFTVAEKEKFELVLAENPTLSWNVAVQKKLYSVLRAYHHKKIKNELNSLHDKLFPSYGEC